VTIKPTPSTTITVDPTHVAALAAMSTRTARVQYACEQQSPPVTTAGIRHWLAAYGYPTTEQQRPQVSRVINAWRRERAIGDTADQLGPLTPERLAELDEIAKRLAAARPNADPPEDDPEDDDFGPPPPPPAAAAEQESARPAREPLTGPSRAAAAVLLFLVGVLLAGVIVAPIALSSQDIIDWAGSPVGLGLHGAWPWVTFLALDAAAAVCVGLVVYCAWRGESAGVFAWLVWAFAGMSAFANYQHSSAPGAPNDAVWFFPAMSLAGPFLLEMIVRRTRKWVQEKSGQRARHSVSFGLARWIPGVGATRETYGAWRLARLDGINDARKAIEAYRTLCPDGSVRILKALRNRK
jgi:hypothetical protein